MLVQTSMVNPPFLKHFEARTSPRSGSVPVLFPMLCLIYDESISLLPSFVPSVSILFLPFPCCLILMFCWLTTIMFWFGSNLSIARVVVMGYYWISIQACSISLFWITLGCSNSPDLPCFECWMMLLAQWFINLSFWLVEFDFPFPRFDSLFFSSCFTI